MLRIITLNLNGIRSAWKKGVSAWVAEQAADFVCLQEIKAQFGDLSTEMRAPGDGLHGYFHLAQKKGYSGVGLYTRVAPTQVVEGLGIPEIDAEGRIVSWTACRRFTLNQDTGGAIKGPGRADLFWGSGPEAEIAAGHLKHPGKLYFLVLRPDASP